MTTSSIAARKVSIGTWLLLAAGASLAAFHLVGLLNFDGFALDLGSLNTPTPKYLALGEMWLLFGGVSAALLALALARRDAGRTAIERLMALLGALSDRRFLWAAGALGLALPACLRLALLHHAPLTDDEGAYVFASRLLAGGHLTVTSPPLKLFFDQNFMINDGRLFPVYFLGWPVLRAAGEIVHLGWVVNPLLSALTIPPIFLVARRLIGPGWARAAVLLFLSSPFLQVVAATELSHTSCLMALTWSVFFLLRCRDADATWRHDAGFSFAFALAFCIRPHSAAALGVPMLLYWTGSTWRLPSSARLGAVVGVVVPAATLGALFLGSLWVQNGSPFQVGYAHYNRYIVENGFRFTSFTADDLTTVAGFDFSQIGLALLHTGSGLLRLNFDLFGWPSSLALLPLGRPRSSSEVRLFWWMVLSYLVAMLFQRDWGIDTIGPMHAFELALPVLVLTVAGARDLAGLIANMNVEAAPRLVAPSLLVGLVTTAWLGFVPVRLEAVHTIADHVNRSLQAPTRAGVHHAVIFAPRPFTSACVGEPSHFVLFRPVNDPWLRDDVLWVNQLELGLERQLMAHFPDRTGVVMTWTPACTVNLSPLPAADPGRLP